MLFIKEPKLTTAETRIVESSAVTIELLQQDGEKVHQGSFWGPHDANDHGSVHREALVRTTVPIDLNFVLRDE